ncbi:hypothetical protein MYCTH_2297169 [Thermothelomyces thermophilus ATCC 42464]|uniref:Uncharacterized protein n=1 Tax=Thermothelomyces thermophilus (strain ATCC 42464 / BCRC 31852 / DSM 1799) TaxID=573729 RepID=G2Q4M9_THET4|nr:uncharacterized protein MYCTH_2297169 [Thermothelomyces thermophilus ATCC 42464]AEO54518.1 hypothetical protein MYCTH_2297169 [Thermothelomyces thermophilus ATCC 42464]
MASTVATPLVTTVEFMPRAAYEPAKPGEEDPFRHRSASNSHNHHDLHPWGPDVVAGSREFDALYAEANNQYMYHLWYSDALTPFMATRVLSIAPIKDDLLNTLQEVLRIVLESGVAAALSSAPGQLLVDSMQRILDSATAGGESGPIFVRLGATSFKDSFDVHEPSTKPAPLQPRDADMVVRRMLTSGRVVGRLLALSERVWQADPGEAFVIQQWSQEIDMRREVRVFCYRGRVTAVSQDAFWKKLGWREQYSHGFAQAILDLWDRVRGFLPFDTCTMDLLMTPPGNTTGWKARIIEFNGFGTHLNTGSSLFHWVNDADILLGERAGLTIRFVDDWEEDGPTAQDEVVAVAELADEAPDWLELERQLQGKYSDAHKSEQRKEMENAARLPLRGRWCSAF